MTTYLVTFTPLEPYAFGLERNFSFIDGTAQKEYHPYFVKTSPIPEQTALLGTLRYLLLEENKLLKRDFDYTPLAQKRKACIGGESFQFDSCNQQTFGLIKRISPLFILKGDNQIIIPNPMNNIGGKGLFSPMKLETGKFCSRMGDISFPCEKKEGGDELQYNPKDGHASGYYNITAGDVEAPFQTTVLVGNRKNKPAGASDEDAFFKREVHCLLEGMQFAIYVTVNDSENYCFLDPGKTYLAKMGQKKSLFKVSIKEEDNKLEEQVREHLEAQTPHGMTWYYALSDCRFSSPISYSGFAITEKKSLRNLKTFYSKRSNVTENIRKSQQYNLFQRGSVFYENIPSHLNTHDQVAGFNHIIEIKGKK